jgi:TetR/AcrR family transcriptional repressor of mexCD-oprJ operon
MSTPATDHRRATAERNVQAILDAAERLLAARTTLSMVSLASEAGVSRQTLYSHFAGLPQVVEAAVERAVTASVAAVRSVDPDAGPAGEALERLLEACWMHLARQDALARAAATHVPPEQLHKAHAQLLGVVRDLIARGQQERAFRQDLSIDWLATTLYALLHAADEHARSGQVDRSEALAMLKLSNADLFAAR